MIMTVHIIVVTFMKIKQKLAKGSLMQGHLYLNGLQKNLASQTIFTKYNHNIQLKCLVLRLSCGIWGLYIKRM